MNYCHFSYELQRYNLVHEEKKNPHVCTTKRKKNRHVCTKCANVFTTKFALKDHMDRHDNKGTFYCGHVNSHIIEESPCICKTCDKRFAYKSNLKRHQAKCNGAKSYFECNKCGKKIQLKGCCASMTQSKRFQCKK